MADVPAHTPIFSRGSTVLDYWLAHAEGLIIQPSGARVEEVVVGPPIGRAEALIVRSRMTRRRKAIPAESIAAVEPAAGNLLLDAAASGAGLRIPRPSPERIAAARVTAERGGRIARAQVAGAANGTQAGARSALAWVRPRAVLAGTTAARHLRNASARTAMGVSWLTPRAVASARAAGAAGARLVLAAAVVAARSAAAAAHGLEHVAAVAAERGRASLEARRARQRRAPDD